MSNLNLLHGDCLEKLKTLPANSVDAIVTDPPYGVSILGNKWDYDVPSVEIWEECLRVLKPGGHLLAFASTRTQHRMATRIEDAGFEIRDMLSWVYGSGFPKNLNVSSAIDKQRHTREEVLKVTAWVRFMRDINGLTNKQIDSLFKTNGMASHWTSNKSQPYIPTLEQIGPLLELFKCPEDKVPQEIKRLIFEINGKSGEPGKNWKLAEVVGVHDKKSASSIWSENYGEKVAKSENLTIKEAFSEEAKKWQGWGTCLKPAVEPITMARKPFNGTVADCVREWGTSAINVDGCAIDTDDKIKQYKTIFKDGKDKTVRYPANFIHDGSPEVVDMFPSKGSKNESRFFYCPKPTPKEREEGLENINIKTFNKKKNIHPTVKPIELMSYLCKMVTPPNGVVLDPFMGSGSTGKAAKKEGFNFIGIERDQDFFNLAKARCGILKEIGED